MSDVEVNFSHMARIGLGQSVAAQRLTDRVSIA